MNITDEMVERAAEAVCKERHGDGTWKYVEWHIKEHCRWVARAALEAALSDREGAP